jgi:hypothetical protein
MDSSLEKAGALHTEHAAVMNDAFRSMSEEAAEEVQPPTVTPDALAALSASKPAGCRP